MTYNDITYCSRECANMECKRNQKHLPKSPIIISMAEFTDCENWYVSEANKMFEKLGYKRYETEDYFEWRKDGITIDFDLQNETVTKYDMRDDAYECITMAELKAINKKCQELGWE